MNEERIKKAEHMAFEHASGLVRRYRTVSQKRLTTIYALTVLCLIEAVIIVYGAIK